MDGQNEAYDREAEECPIKMSLDYTENELIFKWNYQDIHVSLPYYCRSFLILDVDSLGSTDISTELACAHYNRLPLGHFLKVLFVGYSLRQPWIQKTLCKQEFKRQLTKRDQTLDILSAVRLAVKQAVKLDEITDIVIITGNKDIYEKLPRMRKIKEEIGYEYPFMLFLHSKTKEHLKSSFIIQYFENSQELKNSLKEHVKKRHNIKIACCQIRLRSLKGDILLDEAANKHWQTNKDGILFRNHYFLKSGREYSQSLTINNLNCDKTLFDFEFYAKLMDSRMYLLALEFSINPQNKSNSERVSRQNNQENNQVFKSTSVITQIRRRWAAPGNQPQRIVIGKDFVDRIML